MDREFDSEEGDDALSLSLSLSLSLCGNSIWESGTGSGTAYGVVT